VFLARRCSGRGTRVAEGGGNRTSLPLSHHELDGGELGGRTGVNYFRANRNARPKGNSLRRTEFLGMDGREPPYVPGRHHRPQVGSKNILVFCNGLHFHSL